MVRIYTDEGVVYTYFYNEETGEHQCKYRDYGSLVKLLLMKPDEEEDFKEEGVVTLTNERTLGFNFKYDVYEVPGGMYHFVKFEGKVYPLAKLSKDCAFGKELTYSFNRNIQKAYFLDQAMSGLECGEYKECYIAVDEFYPDTMDIMPLLELSDRLFVLESKFGVHDVYYKKFLQSLGNVDYLSTHFFDLQCSDKKTGRPLMKNQRRDAYISYLNDCLEGMADDDIRYFNHKHFIRTFLMNEVKYEPIPKKIHKSILYMWYNETVVTSAMLDALLEKYPIYSKDFVENAKPFFLYMDYIYNIEEDEGDRLVYYSHGPLNSITYWKKKGKYSINFDLYLI